MHHFSESEWRRATALVKRQQRREMLFVGAGMALVVGVVADLMARGPASLGGRFFVWLVGFAVG